MTTAAPAAERGDALAGTGPLVKMWLRRDRIMIPCWIYVLTALVATTVYSFKDLYDTPQSRAHYAAGINGNPSTRALYGPVFAPDTVAGLAAWRYTAIGSALVGVMCVLLVVRHSRAEEETGRLELVGAAVVGRRAPLTAALLTAATAACTIATLVAVVMMALGMPAGGSIAFGLGWLATGLVFTGVAAITAQLGETSRLASGLALTVLGVTYLLRAVADAGSAHWLSWLSPIGWAQRVRPFAGNDRPVLLLPVATSAILVTVAYRLIERRDLGAGIIAPRPGPARAARSLRSPLALSWRLQRGTVAFWAGGVLIYGLAIGGIADDVRAFVEDSDSTLRSIRDMGGGQANLVDAFLVTGMGIMALFAAAYAVQSVLRIRAEETGGRLEPLLATSATRVRWALAQLTVTVGGTIALLTLTGIAMGIMHGSRAHDLGGQVPRLLGAALVQLPAVWVIVAVTVLFFGFFPRATSAGWGVLTVCVVLGQIGPVLKLPQAVMDSSPFTHTPKVPGGEFSAVPLVALTAVAVAVTAAALVGFRRRDIG